MGFANAGVAFPDGANLAIAGVHPQGMASAGNVIWRAAQPLDLVISYTFASQGTPSTGEAGMWFRLNTAVTLTHIGRYVGPTDPTAATTMWMSNTAPGTANNIFNLPTANWISTTFTNVPGQWCWGVPSTAWSLVSGATTYYVRFSRGTGTVGGSDSVQNQWWFVGDPVVMAPVVAAFGQSSQATPTGTPSATQRFFGPVGIRYRP